MTDQCKHCTLRGDLIACQMTDCHKHEDWINIKLQKVIDTQAEELERLRRHCVEFIWGEDNPELYESELTRLRNGLKAIIQKNPPVWNNLSANVTMAMSPHTLIKHVIDLVGEPELATIKDKEGK